MLAALTANHVEPSVWQFPTEEDLPDDDLVAVGADLEPSTVLDAYERGCFPMPVTRKNIGWFCPRDRGIIRPNDLHISRSLRRSLGRYDVSINQDFDGVIAGCADPSRPNGWIDRRITDAYRRLHAMGWVHSVEVWDGDCLAGGLYGLGLGSFFAGESMFHRSTDASKVALVALVETIAGAPGSVIDVQWLTPHLASLGAIEVSRQNYRALSTLAQTSPGPFPVRHLTA